MLAQPVEGGTQVIAKVGWSMGLPWIADQGYLNPFLGSQPLERLGLSIEVKIVSARVINVDGKLAGLEVCAPEQIGGVRGSDLSATASP